MAPQSELQFANLEESNSNDVASGDTSASYAAATSELHTDHTSSLVRHYSNQLPLPQAGTPGLFEQLLEITAGSTAAESATHTFLSEIFGRLRCTNSYGELFSHSLSTEHSQVLYGGKPGGLVQDHDGLVSLWNEARPRARRASVPAREIFKELLLERYSEQEVQYLSTELKKIADLRQQFLVDPVENENRLHHKSPQAMTRSWGSILERSSAPTLQTLPAARTLLEQPESYLQAGQQYQDAEGNLQTLPQAHPIHLAGLVAASLGLPEVPHRLFSTQAPAELTVRGEISVGNATGEESTKGTHPQVTVHYDLLREFVRQSDISFKSLAAEGIEGLACATIRADDKGITASITDTGTLDGRKSWSSPLRVALEAGTTMDVSRQRRARVLEVSPEVGLALNLLPGSVTSAEVKLRVTDPAELLPRPAMLKSIGTYYRAVFDAERVLMSQEVRV